LGILLALIVAGAITWSRARDPKPFGTDHDRYNNKTFTCMNVVDGDTLDIDTPDGMKASTRIRLWGVDTPETVKPGTPPMYFGREASDYTKSRVLHRPVRIVLAPSTTRDRYDRLLAYVYPADTDAMLNEELLEQGYAYADTRFAHAWRERFAVLEARARKAGAGLWASVRIDQMPEWRQRLERHGAERRPARRK
jgi:micrococcal nuclease